MVGLGVSLCVLFAVWVVTPYHMSSPPTVLLPKTNQPSPIEARKGDVNVTVWPLGKCAIERQLVSCADLGPQLKRLVEPKQRRILVRGDERVSFGEIRSVLQSLHESGVQDTVLVTKYAHEQSE